MPPVRARCTRQAARPTGDMDGLTCGKERLGCLISICQCWLVQTGSGLVANSILCWTTRHQGAPKFSGTHEFVTCNGCPVAAPPDPRNQSWQLGDLTWAARTRKAWQDKKRAQILLGQWTRLARQQNFNPRKDSRLHTLGRRNLPTRRRNLIS